MDRVIAFINLVGFFLQLDFDVFFRWYCNTILHGKHISKFNKLDTYVSSRVENKKGMSQFDLVHRQPLGFLLLFIGALLSVFYK